ncbi:PstS family phosphate ABC transporter substrate-binding protein [Flavobacterium sandaracinum]|uniref:Phosphate ABC transporter substrate-binding protein n=1 Tax=Flavobacterium sandaracinum TaxID=2541733 RepID=A0A4R5CVC8_9FLAO|nr:substrate-binding domain-containing protein [Flavobacterium sandaracinum]TDE03627.1 phosphate ABC transporter substrate-binding protein [Flavobacterium sandaracinum]
MKKFAKLPYFVFLLVVVYSCNQTNTPKEEETILKGKASLFVDETLSPIIEDQIAVFESKYKAKITLIAKSESEVLNSLFNEKGAIAILSRNLTKEELDVFKAKKINPKITPFATDAVAFISNKNSKDSIVSLKEVIAFMQGKPTPSIKGLVFDNLNSSTVRYMKSLAGIESIPKSGVFSFKTNDEVIKYVSENTDMIGVVGVNWLSQPQPAMVQYVDKVNALKVTGLSGNESYLPSQNNIAEKKYPLARDLYIINCQGYSGLGMGFASFVSGDIGQRIILKSGLLPIRIPGRKFIIDRKSKNDEK